MTTLSFILAADDPAPNPFFQFIPLVLMVVMFYFLLIRPQRMRQKAIAEQVAAMKKGDRVISAGGIHGTIANVKDDSVLVKVAENVKLEFQKSSIITVIPKGTDKADVAESDKPAAANGEPLRG